MLSITFRNYLDAHRALVVSDAALRPEIQRIGQHHLASQVCQPGRLATAVRLDEGLPLTPARGQHLGHSRDHLRIGFIQVRQYRQGAACETV